MFAQNDYKQKRLLQMNINLLNLVLEEINDVKDTKSVKNNNTTTPANQIVPAQKQVVNTNQDSKADIKAIKTSSIDIQNQNDITVKNTQKLINAKKPINPLDLNTIKENIVNKIVNELLNG